MRIAVTADLHLHNYTQYASLEDGRNSRLEWILKAFDGIVNISVERGCDALVIAGDTFHSRKSIDINVLESAYKRLRDASKRIRLIILEGNHDISEASRKSTSIQVFSEIAEIITKPVVITIAGSRIGFLPWTDSRKKTASALKFLKKRATYLIGHIALRSGVVGVHEYVMEGGIEPSVFRDFEWVLLGHYHKHQCIRDNIYYVGSPIQHTWGESGDTKGFMIAGSTKPEFVELPDFPRFIKVRNPDDAETVRGIDYVKVVGSPAMTASLELPEDVKRIDVIEKSKDYKPRLEIDDTSLKTVITKYCRTFPHETVDEDVLIEIGLGYLKS